MDENEALEIEKQIIREHLEEAIKCLDGARNLESAAHRVADAGALLRAVLERRGFRDLRGLDEPTIGVRAVLPRGDRPYWDVSPKDYPPGGPPSVPAP